MSSTFRWQPVLLACLIVSIGQFSMGLVFPSLPWIAKDFSISSDTTQLLISFYLLGFGPSQLIYGPLSDALGRKPILLTGLILALIGLSLIIFASDTYAYLVAGRFIQGLGAGACAVLSRASLRDSYEQSELPKALSWLAIVASFTPIMAPVFGGFINHTFGWLMVFITLFTYISLVLLILIFSFTETLSDKHSVPKIPAILRDYKRLLGSRYFLSFASLGWLNYSIIVLTISIMPFIMQVQIGMTSDRYALWALIPAFGLLTGGMLCNKIRPVIGTQKMLFVSPFIHLTAAIWFMTVPLNPLLLMLGQFLVTVGNGISFPCAQAQLLLPYKHKSGSVAALSGAGQMLYASLMSMFLMQIGLSQAWHLGIFIFICALVSFACMKTGFTSQPEQ